jgi:hypothetical protein
MWIYKPEKQPDCRLQIQEAQAQVLQGGAKWITAYGDATE